MGSLTPGKSIVYERDDQNRVWARYHNETDRWLVGGPPAGYNSFADWQDLISTARENRTLEVLLEKTINTYRLIKNEKSN